MTEEKPRKPVAGRARKRAIRAHASQAGVPYSVAARRLAMAGTEPSASTGRTVYPAGPDEHRRWLIDHWLRRPYALRVQDTRQAAALPLGRAEHLTRRFPVARGGPFYHGESRVSVLAMLYAVAGHERPECCPAVEELAWIAELGEDAAVDLSCAELDRAARAIVAGDRWRMWTRIEAVLEARADDEDPLVRGWAFALTAELRSLALTSSVAGARHTLDAVLISSADGHAPGTRVRILVRPHRGRTGTIVGAVWAAKGAPVGYEVRPDGVRTLEQHPVVRVDPHGLTLLDDSRSSPPIELEPAT